MTELLDKHLGIVFRDLNTLTTKKRRLIADQIEQAEGLESAKQAVLREVVMGEKQIKDVAKTRVLSTHAHKDRKNV